MKFCQHLILTFVVCLAGGCSSAGGRHESEDKSVCSDSISYAKGFTIEEYDGYTSVEVRNPWDTTRLLQRYILVDRDKPMPSSLPKGTIVKTPIRDIAVYSSVHVSIIDQLGETDKISGVCEPRYINIPSVLKKLADGQISDLGESTSPNIEKMIEKGVEVIIASPFQNSSYGAAEKIGVPIIEGADYMESTPLGRTEWIRFYGLLFGKREKADSIFTDTEKKYNDLVSLITDTLSRPTMFVDKKYGSSWYVSKGESVMANLYKDAGAEYMFADLEGSGSQPFSFETVFDKCIHADYWLIKYNQPTDLTYEELSAEYQPYSNFDAYKNKKIYGCNTGEVPFYEEYPLHPDLLLADLIYVFHPNLLPDHELRYFKPLK